MAKIKITEPILSEAFLTNIFLVAKSLFREGNISLAISIHKHTSCSTFVQTPMYH